MAMLIRAEGNKELIVERGIETSPIDAAHAGISAQFFGYQARIAKPSVVRERYSEGAGQAIAAAVCTAQKET